MQNYTNRGNISLILAAWLAHDDYDNHNPPVNEISVTTLLKPIRSVILGQRVPQEITSVDVADRVAARFGQAVHADIENIWADETKWKPALRSLGYPEKFIQSIRINPDPLTVKGDDVPIYFEQRQKRQIGNYLVSGKFDIVYSGEPQDNKIKKVYSYIKNSSDEEFILQMSIYRWLNPEICTEDNGVINYIFKDWLKHDQYKPNYPKGEVLSKNFQLMSLTQTEFWLESRIEMLDELKDVPQSELPQCTPDELWMDAPVYKYYSNPDNRTKSTKNFTNKFDADRHCLTKGQGVVVTVLGKPKRCGFCEAKEICEQRRQLQETLGE